jgi:hypothetical protein
MTTKAQALGIALLFLGALSCRSSQPTTAPAPAVVKPVPVKDEEGNELTEPEKVRSEQVQNDNRGVKTVTVGNVNGNYVLSCNMKADNCVTPAPGKNYYIFNKNTKWKMPGATKSITLSWIQDWSVEYPNGENIALIPAEGGAPEEMGMYWLDSWSADTKPNK